MVNNNVLYRATGRYMEGQRVIGYHIVGEDGSQSKENKDRIIWLINNGYISNMRLQIGKDKEIIIRGKGINLNKLPVYDINKGQIRDNGIGESVDSSRVDTNRSKVTDINKMGQFTIIKRIMYKNKCLGYELIDYSGQITRKKREDVIKMATEKLISNANVQRTKVKGEEGKYRPILRGVDCDINQLPILIVEDTGRIVDPSKNKSNVVVRSTILKNSGILRNLETDRISRFRTGDCLICGIGGEVKVVSRIEVEKDYSIGDCGEIPICDCNLHDRCRYEIEFFGSKKVNITDKMIKTWKVLKHN